MKSENSRNETLFSFMLSPKLCCKSLSGQELAKHLQQKMSKTNKDMICNTPVLLGEWKLENHVFSNMDALDQRWRLRDMKTNKKSVPTSSSSPKNVQMVRSMFFICHLVSFLVTSLGSSLKARVTEAKTGFTLKMRSVYLHQQDCSKNQ